MSAYSNYHAAMRKSLQDVVAGNIARLMDNPAAPLTQGAVGKRSGLPQRTVGRLKNGSTAASLTTLEAISKGLEVDPWQLLIPDLDPKNLPVLVPTTPSGRRLYKKFQQLFEDIKETSK